MRVSQTASGRGSDNWLASVPDRWQVAPLYARYELTLGKMLDAKRITGRHLAPYVRNVDVQWDRVNVEDLPLMDFDPTERKRFRLRRGDLLVCEGGEVGRTALWRGELAECYFQKAIHRLRPLQPREEPRFLLYVMRAAAETGMFVAGGNANTIDHLTSVRLRRTRFPFPPHDEQRAIADFLDRETAKTDTFISARLRHMELIREEFEARVDRMTRRAGRLIKLRRLWSEVDYGISETGWLGGTFPVLTMGDIHEGFLSIPDGEGVDSVDRRLLLNPGDLVFNRTNSRELVGKVGLYRGPEGGEVTFASYLVRMRCNDLILPEYANFLLNSPNVLAEARSRALLSVNQANLNPNRYGEIEVHLPSVAIQAEVLEALVAVRQRLTDLRRTINIAVERLREYRSALITAAVTGQIDVRSHAS